MTIGEALSDAYTKLTTTTRNPHLEAEMLLSKIIKKPREYFFSYPEHKLTALQLTTYNLQLKKRLKGTPLAYLIGEKEFYGLTFKVGKKVLIPRPETELMVEEALRVPPLIKGGEGGFLVADIGTGSGCIIISIIKQLLNDRFPISNVKFFAIDKSGKALCIAKKNAKFNQVEKLIKFKQGNLLEPILNSKFLTCLPVGKVPNSKFLIVANLPYLTPEQIKNSPTIKHEPKLALTAGKDGLKYYRKLFTQLNSLCVTRYELCVMCEIDPTQKSSIAKLIKQVLPGWKFEIKKDLKGHSRLVIITNTQSYMSEARLQPRSCPR